jgi:Replication-relaxation
MRVSVERVLELVRHLTERDREIVRRLYDQQVLTTDQLMLLYFSSRRRAQDRLLFLYRERVVDRFYPPSRFGAGKPQAHWLLDEAGALIVAAMLGVERKQLGWQRRDDWGSHPQLAHRLETNRFVTELIAATLSYPGMGVTAWYASRDASELLETERLRPDAGFILEMQAGAIECWLEWDRCTETAERLQEKLRGYWRAEHHLRLFAPEPRNILFVVPGAGRIETLRRAYAQLREAEAERVRQNRWATTFQPSWPVVAATAPELRREGPLARVWQRIDRDGEPRYALPALPPRRDLAASDLQLALGRRWRHERPDFWQRLSPLGRPLASEAPEVPEVSETASDLTQLRALDVPNRAEATSGTDPADLGHPTASDGLLALRRELEQEMRADVAAARAAGRLGGTNADLLPSGVDGSMHDPEAKEERWR